MLDGATTDVVLFFLVLWATTGLTIIHLAVLGGRLLAKPFRRRRKREDDDASLPDLSLTFLVPVYNDGLTVGPTIESILRQSVRPQRIIAVNDGSTDDTAAVLETFRARGVDVITLDRNVGKTGALSIALREVDTDLVAITDADSVVHTEYVREILKSFRDPQLAAVGGNVESIPHTWVTAARQIEYMLTVRVDRDAEMSMNALIVLPGVSTTYRTKDLKELGFEFDTIAEDFDLTFRMQKAGKKITMNLRAKVFTSDPPTLRAYNRQLVRWYTDFWLVLIKHRRLLGKRVFGTIEVPMLVLNATASSALYLVLPIYLLFARPADLAMFLGVGLAVDLVLILIAWRAYKRHDVWLALLSRVPTRFIGRWAYLVAMTRVLIGRPGYDWKKLERRRTDAFLAAGNLAKATPTTAAAGARASPLRE